MLNENQARGVVNIYYIESMKKYNAMEEDYQTSNDNSTCKCFIF